MGRLRFELRTNRLKAECSTAELATRRAWGTEVGRPAGAGIRIAIQGCSERITRRVALATDRQVPGGWLSAREGGCWGAPGPVGGALGCRSRVGRGWLARGGPPSAMRMARNPLRFDGPTL